MPMVFYACLSVSSNALTQTDCMLTAKSIHFHSISSENTVLFIIRPQLGDTP